MSKEDVLTVASLARIGVADDEIDRVGDELGAVLGYVERLQAIDTSGVPETAPSAVVAGAFRSDVALPSSDTERERILENFPSSGNGLLKVPAVFEKPKR